MMASQAASTHTVQISNQESNRQILKDFSSNLLGSLSGGMFSFGMGLMLLQQTHLAISFGLSTIIGPIVLLLLLVPMGNIVDRYPHKTILIISNLVRIGGLAVFAWALPQFSGVGKLIPVVLYAIVDAVSGDFSSTAYSSAVHELVNPEKIGRLSSLNSTASSISSIFSPMLGLTLYTLMGFEMFIFIEMASSLISFGIMLSMHFHYAPAAPKATAKPGQLTMFKAGLHYIGQRPLIRGIILVAVGLNFLFTAFTVGVPFIIATTLKLGNGPISYLETAMSVGILVGSVLMSTCNHGKHFRTLLLVPLLLDGVLMASLGLVFLLGKTFLVISVLGVMVMALTGLSVVIPNIVMSVKLQQTVPTEMLGRVSSAMMTANTLIMPVGILFYTVLFQSIRLNAWVFIVSGVLASTYLLMLWPRLQRWLDADDASTVK
ncbi:MAG: MFS transporter [Lactobacillus sp.]